MNVVVDGIVLTKYVTPPMTTSLFKKKSVVKATSAAVNKPAVAVVPSAVTSIEDKTGAV